MLSFYQRLSVGKRILAGFGVCVAVLISIVALNAMTSTKIDQAFQAFRETAHQSLKVGEFAREVYDARLAVFDYTTHPSDDAAVAVLTALEQVAAQQASLSALFARDPNGAEAVEQIHALTDEYQRIFAEVSALETRTTDLIDEAQSLDPEFIKAVNSFLFVARISGDQKSSDHGAAAILAFERGLGEFRSYLLTGDERRFDAAGPRFAEARSELDSALTTIENKGGDVAAVALPIKKLDALRALLPQIYEAVTSRAQARAALSAIGPELLVQFVAVQDAVIARQRAIEAEGEAQIRAGGNLTILVGALGVALAIGAAFVIGRAISAAINQQADAMSRLAEGDLDAPVEGQQHDHELGRMAKALAVFKQNATRMRELDQEKQAADRAAQESRRAMMSGLQRSFGDVVRSGVAGEFAARVEARFDDPELNELAVGVNRLLESVEAGVMETQRVIASIADGDLSQHIDGDFDGAFAELQTDTNSTVERLAQLVAQIRRAAQKIQSSTSNIAAGAKQLSARTEEQASTIEETAATMEEMSKALKGTADHASEANSMAGDAARRAGVGGDVVREAVEAMTEIERSAAQISDIVSVIDGIAFQTNLLALNAAVEAARAGDAGKGFAVVAQEVRALAQRSAEAARDINGLIGDSSANVAHGVKLVGRTGEALSDIEAAIAKVTSTVNEISQAIQEQASGVREITHAVAAMDRTTQQNSALAEQSSAAAEALQKESMALESMIGFFSVTCEAAADCDEGRAA